LNRRKLRERTQQTLNDGRHLKQEVAEETEDTKEAEFGIRSSEWRQLNRRQQRGRRRVRGTTEPDTTDTLSPRRGRRARKETGLLGGAPANTKNAESAKKLPHDAEGGLAQVCGKYTVVSFSLFDTVGSYWARGAQ
jgi:hypothetical protein